MRGGVGEVSSPRISSPGIALQFLNCGLGTVTHCQHQLALPPTPARTL